MITQIRLKNFQKHSDLVIDIDNQITVIRGSSDRGKSSIIRALYWIFFNRPLGSDVFKKEGTKEFSAGITLDDGTVIERGKDKKDSYYLLNEERFSNIGGEVPDVITKILNLDLLNVAGQHDPHFLLTMSKPEASRYLSSLVGLEAMDKALSIAEGMRRKNTAEHASLTQEKDSVEKQLLVLECLPEMGQKIEKLNNLEARLTKLSEDKAFLISALSRIKKITENIAPENAVESLSELVQSLLDTRKLKNSLQEYAKQYFVYTANIAQQSSLEQAENRILSLLELQSSIALLTKNKSDLKRYLASYASLEDSIMLNEKELNRMQKDWDKQTEGRCPLCGNKMKGNS